MDDGRRTRRSEKGNEKIRPESNNTENAIDERDREETEPRERKEKERSKGAEGESKAEAKTKRLRKSANERKTHRRHQ